MGRAAGLSPTAAAELSARLAEFRSTTGLPGLAYSLFTGDEVLFEAREGWRDREARLPVDENTIFGVASLTKSVTCLALLQLAAEGALSLDDPVTEYLPLTLWAVGREPRLRQFMNHTSGLPPLPTMTWLRGPTQKGDAIAGSEAALVRDMAAVRGGPLPRVDTFARLIAYLGDEVEPFAEPGVQFSYSNDAYCLLGAVISEVAGMPFDRFVTARILEPLGMSRSTFSLQRVLLDENHATLYAADGAGRVQRSPAWEDAGVMQGGGALKSTLADLRSYVRFLMEPRRASELGLEQEALETMANGTVWCGEGTRYGLGLQESTAPFAGRLVGHGGGLKGVSSQLYWLPGLDVGAVLLTNLGGLPSGLMALAGINAVTSVDVAAPLYRPGTYSPRPAEVEALLGDYSSGEPYGRVRLYRSEGGGLRAEVGLPADDLEVVMVGADELALQGRWQQQAVSVLRTADGEVSGLFHGLRVLARGPR